MEPQVVAQDRRHRRLRGLRRQVLDAERAGHRRVAQVRCAEARGLELVDRVGELVDGRELRRRRKDVDEVRNGPAVGGHVILHEVHQLPLRDRAAAEGVLDPLRLGCVPGERARACHALGRVGVAAALRHFHGRREEEAAAVVDIDVVRLAGQLDFAQVRPRVGLLRRLDFAEPARDRRT